MRKGPDWSLEARFWARGYALVAGIDEAGRGALAGPVVVAVVVLPYGAYPFDDSKALPAALRSRYAALIRTSALMWAVAEASPAEVDALNVLQATHVAASRALAALPRRPDALVTDYLRLSYPAPVDAPPKADSRSVQVAAASILAKTTRDAQMAELHGRDPRYGFDRHKGYGSPQHLGALGEHGVSAAHRKTFAPVAAHLNPRVRSR